MKQRVYQLLALAEPADRWRQVVDVFLITLIVLNIVAMVLETVEEYRLRLPGFFDWFEAVSVAIFSVEYVLRVWSCTAAPAYSPAWSGRLRFMLTPLAIADLLAILPFFLPLVGIDLRSFRAIRLLRLLRVAKLGRYSEAIKLTGRILSSRKAELLVTAFVLSIMTLLASSLMYCAERNAQPNTFSSIPATMWWAVETLSTVGYGDAYPVTPIGKLLASVIAILGIGMFALPTGILGAGFVEEIQRKKRAANVCPHCGGML